MSINFVCSAVVIDSRLQQDFLTKAAHNMANISILLGISILKYEKKKTIKDMAMWTKLQM